MSEIERLREALEKIAQVGDGYGPRKPGSGTTGEGHARCLEIADAALSSTPPVAERGEWRPIESAPRDGRRLLLAGFQRGIPWVAIGHWAPYAGCVWNSDDMKPLQGVVGYQELPAPPSPRETEGQG